MVKMKRSVRKTKTTHQLDTRIVFVLVLLLVAVGGYATYISQQNRIAQRDFVQKYQNIVQTGYNTHVK